MATSESTGQQAAEPDGSQEFEYKGDPSDPRWRAVVETLSSNPKPRVNRVLLWSNIGVFLVGVFLAAQENGAWDFIMPMRVQGGRLMMVQTPALRKALDKTGMLRRADFMAGPGHWYRLLTCCFVHLGIIHLAFNMFALRSVGADVEWEYGPWRYLVLYLLSGLGGSCAGLATAPALAGASGALCGLIAADAIWLLIFRRYLPPAFVKSKVWSIVITAVLITLLSLGSVVSAMGHIGGAVAGLVVALLLHAQRFGPPVVRYGAVACLLALPVAFPLALKAYLKEQGPQQRPVIREFSELREELIGLNREVSDFSHESVWDLLDTDPKRRVARAVQSVNSKLEDFEDRLSDAGKDLRRIGEMPRKLLEDERQAGIDYFEKRAALIARIRATLSAGEVWKDKARVNEVADLRSQWLALVKLNR